MTHFDDIPADDDTIEPPSKSQIKREMTALQKLGGQIVDLSEKLLEQMPIDGLLKTAILECRNMKHREGRRRQLQYIGKLMRSADHEAIKEAFEHIEAGGRENVQLQHQAERWRDRLISGGNEIFEELLQLYPDADRQHLRQLIRGAQKELAESKPPASARKLFRYLRDLMDVE